MADEVLGRIAIEMDLKDSKFRTNLQGTNKAVRNAMSEMKANMAVVSQAGSKYDILATKQRGLTRVLEAQSNQLQALKRQYEGSLTASGEWTNATASYAKKYNDTSGKVAQLNKQLAVNAQKMEIARTNTTGLTGALNSLGGMAVSAGDKLKGIGGSMTSKVTTPLAAGFTYAMKSAVDFNSQIQAMGPLLTNGGAITAKYKAQLDQLSNSSLQWSKQYGVSTTSINEGMAELIRNGYDVQQTLGAMPNILDASKASGEDFNEVMTVTTATLEQFNLKGKTTNETLKNTQRVADVLTYVANATSTGFSEIGEAMTYVGPTANAANISLEETAGALGVLAQNGIKGSVAGTSLRSVLNKMLRPTNQQIKAFKELGVNIEDFSKGTLPLPDMLEKIKKHTADWNNEKRASVVATAVGTEAQAGFNTLVKDGGKALREYTKGAQESGGVTKKIADQLNNTEKAKLERFKQSVHVLAIEVGQKLLPAFTPIIEKASDWINAFSKMDSSTQQTIIKLGLFAGALGPMAMLIGNILTPMGKLAQGTVKVVGFFRAWKAGTSVLQSVSASTGIATSAFKTGSGALGNLATKSAASKASLALLGESASGAGTAISLLNPWILGTVAAVGLGVTIWELWGKKMYQSADSTNRWGTGVSETADKALSSMKDTTQGINDALNNMSDATQNSTKKMSKAFDDEFSAISKTVDTRTKEINDGLKGLDKNVKEAVEKEAKKEKKSLQDSLENAKDHYNQAQAILKNHNGKISDLSNEERAMLRNNQQAMQEEELEILNITGSKKKTIMAALNNDVTKMTSAQRKNAEAELADYQRKEIAHFTDQKKKLAKAYGENSEEYKAGVKELESSISESSAKTAAAYIRVAKANGESTESIKRDMLQVGLSYKNGMAELEKQSKKLSKSTGIIVDTTGEMSKKVKNAGDAWNKLVFDPKTGKVKTNAQEEVTKAVKSEKQWDNIRLLVKEGKLNTNAREMVANAIFANNKWETLTWKEQKALIKSKGGKELVKMLEDGGEWNDLSLETKNAIVNAKGKKEIVDALFSMGQWNSITPKQQELLVHDKATSKVIAILKELGQWDNLDPKTQNLIVNGDRAAMRNMLMELDHWNSLSLKEQKALIDDKATAKFYEIFRNTDQWNNLDLQQKEAVLNSKGTNELIQTLQQAGIWNSLSLKKLQAVFGVRGKADLNDALFEAGKWDELQMREKVASIVSKGGKELFQLYADTGRWNSLSVEAKQAIVNAKGGRELQQAITDYNLWREMPAEALKNIVAQDNASGNIELAKQALENWQQANPGQKKVLESMDIASGPIQAATGAVNRYKETPTGPAKIASGQDLASGPLSRAKGSVDNYRNTSEGPAKKGIALDMASGAMGNASRSITGFRNTSPGGAKNAKAIDNASGPANNATKAVEGFNSKKDHTVTLTTVFKSIIEKVTGHAKGTNYHPGGLMMVNDQPGPVFRELVQFPSGETFIPQGRNVMFDAPRGSKVLTASKTARRFPGLKQYARGTELEPKLMSNMRYLNARDLVVGSSSSNVVVNNNQADISKLEAKFDTMIGLMQALVEKPTDIVMSAQKVGRMVSPEVANQQVNGINLESRGVWSGS